jgi:hypothetical protein
MFKTLFFSTIGYLSFNYLGRCLCLKRENLVDLSFIGLIIGFIKGYTGKNIFRFIHGVIYYDK